MEERRYGSCTSGASINCFSVIESDGCLLSARATSKAPTNPRGSENDDDVATSFKEDLDSSHRCFREGQLDGDMKTSWNDPNPDIIEKRLEQLEDAISRIRQKKAYERALFLSSAFVQDRDFRLMFLRADGFHPRKAAERIVTFFSSKLELFGVDNLVRRITIEDLTYHERNSIHLRLVSILPERDGQGRTVFCYHGNWENNSIQVRMGSSWQGKSVDFHALSKLSTGEFVCQFFVLTQRLVFKGNCPGSIRLVYDCIRGY